MYLCIVLNMNMIFQIVTQDGALLNLVINGIHKKFTRVITYKKMYE